MSEVADGPETKVIGRPSRAAGASAVMALGTSATIWSVRTTQTWRSGTSVSARRPDAVPPSRTIVPVCAIASAQPVITPSTTSSSATGSGGSSGTSSIPSTSITEPGAQARRRAPCASHAARTAAAASCVRWTAAR
jgi:hypothetical protein